MYCTPVSSPVATSGSIGCRLWLQSSVSVVRLWLQPPVSVACGSSVCCSWLQSPVLALLSFVAPGVSVVRGSGISSCICRLLLWLQHLLLMVLPPVSVACSSSMPPVAALPSSSLFQWLSSRQSSSVLAIFLQNSVLVLYLSKYRQITTTGC